MSPFDFYLPTRIVFASGAIQQLGKLAREWGAKRVLMVSDTGVVRAGHFQSGAQSLTDAGLEVASFHDFAEKPQ